MMHVFLIRLFKKKYSVLSSCNFIFYLLLYIFLILFFSYKISFAQNNNNLNELVNRLNSIEKNIQDLSRQVFKGIPPKNEFIEDSNKKSDPDQKRLASNEIRMSDIEVELRRLTGLVENAIRKAEVIEVRLDKLVSDLDNRLAIVEKNISEFQKTKNKNNLSKLENVSDIDQSVKDGNLDSIEDKAELLTKNEFSGILPEASPEEQYTFARQYLIKLNYESAEKAFLEFINKNGDHKLVSNAYYWLGESYYVRQNYAKAAGAFIDGYNLHPNGNKAPDSLLKLGMSLFGIGKIPEACSSFEELLLKFPEASPRLRRRAVQETVKVGCKN
ncbi:tol-pal system protein YbgF [Alphaproteobacteria bacterium]|nr:tol-pal system protein YbgF [Alphaproteobacteria bacterium]